MAPSGPLGPDAREAAPASGPPKVVFAAPTGEAEVGAEIAIVFNRALIPLAAADPVAPNVLLTPAIPGSFRWVGARALVFAPDAGRLPNATRITVEVPGNLSAPDGLTLGEPFRFTFETPRPAIVQSEPGDGATGVHPTAPLRFELNQAVDPKLFERFGRLTAAGKPVLFSARRERPELPKKLVVEPRGRLPIDAEVRFALEDALTGEEGPLPAGKTQLVTYRTYGPLRVTTIDCNRESVHGNCQPGSSVGLSFSNPVRFGDLKRAIGLAPALPFSWPRWYDDASTVTYVEIPAKLEAGRRYTVTVASGLRDEHGQALARDFQSEIVMDDYFPRVAIGMSEGTLLAADRAPIPLVAVNTKGAKVRAAALTRDDVARLAAGAISFEELLRRHAGAREFALPASPRTNQVVHSALDPAAVLPAGLGVLGLLAEYPREERDYGAPRREKLAKVSDIGITAKLSRAGSLLWLTRLSSAAPIVGADVELARPDGQRRRYRSDADGLVTVPPTDFAPNLDWNSPDRKAVVFASLGDDWNYERFEDVAAPWASGVPIDLAGTALDDGLLFTDRGVYRPGDAVRIKGVVRRQTLRGSVVPSGQKATIVLRGPSEDVLRKAEVSVSTWGTFDTTLTLPSASGLGSYLLSAALGRNELTTRVEVQAYRPQELRVDVTAPPAAVRGAVVPFAIQGSYLFGAPVGSGDVRYSVTRQATTFAPPGAEALITDARAYYAELPDRALSGGPLADQTSKLDAVGALTVNQALTLPGQSGPERVLLEAEVTDVARATAAGRASLLVHPADFYIGLETLSGFVEKTPAKLTPRLLLLSHEGVPQKGRRVDLELVERRYASPPDDSGAAYKVVDTTVSRCAVMSGSALAGCALTAQKAGYYLVIARAKDSAGRVAEAAVPLYALGGDGVAFRTDDANLELVLDKKTYRVGERARVLVKSPFPEAEALITVERAGILSRERRSLRGSMPSFEVPVTEELRPNAFVGVHMVRKIGGARDEKAYRFGYAAIQVDAEDKRLAVAVTPNQRELQPGAEVEVAVSVTDTRRRGARSEVTLYAVDEGVLLLTAYQVPDPLPVFTATRSLQVGTLETRSNLATIQKRALDSLLFGFKGDEGGGGGDGSVRRDFQQTAYFNPRLETDANGRALVKFRLPESLTRFRVMAVAVGEGERYGFGSTDVTTSKRLMVRPALPRFLRVGDRARAGVVVSGKRFGPAEVVVRATLEGIESAGPLEQRVALPADGSVEVKFDLRATRAGRAKLTFTATSGRERDAVLVEPDIAVPTFVEATSVAGATDDAIAERLGRLDGLRADVGGLEVSVAPTVLVGLDSALKGLAEYPYGCTEQLASRLVGMVLRPSLTAEPASPGTLARSSGPAVRDVLARQRMDGGFGFWDDARDSHAWVSAYALSVLRVAAQRGAEVPERVFQSGKEYLRRYLGGTSPEAIDAATAAYAVDALSVLGDPDAGFMNRVFERRAELPLFAKALLVSALANGKGDARQVDALVQDLERAVRVTGRSATVIENTGDAYAVLMDSNTRTHAMVLRALLLARPKHPLIPALTRGLIQARRGGSWATTQETAFSLLALDKYRATAEPESPDLDVRVSLGDRTLFETELGDPPFRGKRKDVPMAELLRGARANDALVFEREGRGTLFYEARLRYARAELPKTPFDAGLFVEKTLRAVDPAALGSIDSLPPVRSATQFAAADLVLAELTVVNSSPREYVAIDDPLPAGFQGINTTFATTASRYELGEGPTGECPECGPTERDEIAHERRVRRTEHRREMHDDRVVFLVDHLTPGIHRFRYLARATTFGSFVVPPVRAFAMYEPEVSGRTAASSVEVR